MKFDPLIALGIYQATSRRAAPQPKPVSRLPAPAARATFFLAPYSRKAPSQEDIDRARGYVSALGGQAK